MVDQRIKDELLKKLEIAQEEYELLAPTLERHENFSCQSRTPFERVRENMIDAIYDRMFEKGEEIVSLKYKLNALSLIAMPDKKMSLACRDDYGYYYEGVLPIGRERAIELFRQKLPILKLYDNNTEAYVDTFKDIKEHCSYDGIFGIEIEDWVNSQEYQELAA